MITTKTVTAISVAPDGVNIAIGKTQQYTATAKYVDGTTADVTGTAAWKCADATVATVNASGLATAIAGGSTAVSATMSGINGSVTLTVPAAAKTLTSIAVTPAATTIAIGATAQFSASATYSDGSTADVTATATWASATPSVATINSGGLATAVAAGSASITATMAGITGTATLTVPPPAAPTLTSIAVTPATASVQVGATQQFTATATYSDGTTANITATATWASAKPTVATVSAAGLATGVTAGSSTVTATVSGVTGTATLTVAAKTVTSIAVTPATATVGVGAMQPFIATATYSDQTTANVTASATWTSANPAVATVNAAGIATGVAPGSSQVTAAIGSISGSAMLTVKTVTSIAVTPSSPSFVTGATEQLTATATYGDNTTGNVTSSVTWSVANPAIATISATGVATAVALGSTTATAILDGVTGTVSMTVTAGANIPTWHVDTNRSGLNAHEAALAPANVTPQSFGKKFSYLVDGYAYAEPLLISNVTIQGTVHNVLYVATEADSVYAFDADTYGTGVPLWKVSLLQGGETPITGASIQPSLGITSTPVIDTQSNTMYVVSTQRSSTTGSSFRLNALDITTGAQKFGGPVTIKASVPATNSDAVNGVENLTTSCIQRAALLLANGNVYMGFGSCHSGWLLAYDAHSLAQVGVFNASPNLNGEGKYASAGGVWMGGGGPAADAAGNVYITTGNGPWDGKAAFGDSVIRFSPTLQLLDYFTPQDYAYMNCQDADLAAGGLLLIPGTSQALAGGKMGRLYLVNTANLGQEQANDAGVTQTLFFESDLITPYSSSCTDPGTQNTHMATVNSYEIFGTAAYFNGSVYLGITPTSTSAPAGVRQFAYANGVLTPGSYTSPWVQENTRGTTPFISANGTSNGILWMIDTGQPLQSPNGATTATLRAYDAVNLSNEIYNSGTNSTDAPGFGIKFSSPVVANGKVYISTGHDSLSVPNPRGEIDVYGLH